MDVVAYLQKNYVNFPKLKQYFELIEKHNQKHNLTGFSGKTLWLEGIYQSLEVLKAVKKGKLLDIGSGAGFPSLPWAIVNSSIELTIYEPLQKRASFLQLVVEELGLKNVLITSIRAEESRERHHFDFICARAVASLPILIEISHHLLKNKGQMIFLKGPKLTEELIKAQSLIKKLSLIYRINRLEINAKNLQIITLTKTQKSPPYMPRKWQQIKKDYS